MISLYNNLFNFGRAFKHVVYAVIIMLITVACVTPTDPDKLPQNLVLLESWPLNIKDPSGLSKSHLPDHLYTVSDKTGHVYLINKRGDIVDRLTMNGHDLEGIEYVAEKDLIFIVEEQKRWVVSLTRDGMAIDTFQLQIPVQNLNDGPEGIAWHSKRRQFFIVNEKNPAILYVYDSLFNMVAQHPLSFAGDYSSVDYDEHTDHLWILSDESKLLARCNEQGKPDKMYYTNLPKGEGVVVDSPNNRIYIVCDESETLYVFSFP